ncbi:hypothetical protein HMPREF0454_04762 [Hafnia alvei ATCC 51873]|uniref:Uncharacterized protein n=1 Tax=Hafnia alvei ATCC 51873 TaxID=1002364 RepID=G9YDR4_HAFAL|nr:hypothetical protein HMPREF0454_04762 [Hafnia alvei ATCC 51873]
MANNIVVIFLYISLSIALSFFRCSSLNAYQTDIVLFYFDN